MNRASVAAPSGRVASPGMRAETVDRVAGDARVSGSEAEALRIAFALRAPPGKQREDPLDSR